MGIPGTCPSDTVRGWVTHLLPHPVLPVLPEADEATDMAETGRPIMTIDVNTRGNRWDTRKQYEGGWGSARIGTGSALLAEALLRRGRETVEVIDRGALAAPGYTINEYGYFTTVYIRVNSHITQGHSARGVLRLMVQARDVGSRRTWDWGYDMLADCNSLPSGREWVRGSERTNREARIAADAGIKIWGSRVIAAGVGNKDEMNIVDWIGQFTGAGLSQDGGLVLNPEDHDMFRRVTRREHGRAEELLRTAEGHCADGRGAEVPDAGVYLGTDKVDGTWADVAEVARERLRKVGHALTILSEEIGKVTDLLSSKAGGSVIDVARWIIKGTTDRQTRQEEELGDLRKKQGRDAHAWVTQERIETLVEEIRTSCESTKEAASILTRKVIDDLGVDMTREVE